jgi:alkaline phosphatase
MTLPRRDFLKLSSAAAGLLALNRASVAQPPALAATPASRPARNVIFMVADGMSTGTLELADLYSRLTHVRPLRWTGYWNQVGVRRASCITQSANGYVTDSAAAASTWGIGRRVNNGSINITPDQEQHEPILVTAQKAGLGTGLVTTTRITHATPAGFFANVPDRDLEHDIAAQLLERRVDVAMGGGAGAKYVSRDLLAKHADLKVLRTRDELLAHSGASPVLGLFADDHLPFSLDRTPGCPTLAEMTASALRLLSFRNDKKGFILQVEGGRVDHAAHSNDAGSLINDMLDFDDAIHEALEFVLGGGRTDTLIVITTDHGCANPGLTLYAQEGVKAFQRLTAVKHSFEWIEAQAKPLTDAARQQQICVIVEHATGIALTADECATLSKTLRGETVNPFRPANTFGPVLGSLLANHFGVAFLSPNHTSDFVEVTALGPGSETMPPLIENTWFHGLLMATVAHAK